MLPNQQDRQPIDREQLRQLIGAEIGVSDWQIVDQARIDLFANATGDHQFLHVDPDRVQRETPYKTTIAHGFLTLSLLPSMAFECLPELKGRVLSLNYGFDKIRFVAPVPSGARVRGRFILSDCNDRSESELLCRYQVNMEIEGLQKPAFVADWLSLVKFA